MYLKCLQKPRCLGWFKTSQAKRSIRRVENKVEFLERQFHSEKLSFVQRNWAFFWTFFLSLVSFMGVFSILKCKTLVLKTTTSWSRPRREYASSVEQIVSQTHQLPKDSLTKLVHQEVRSKRLKKLDQRAERLNEKAPKKTQRALNLAREKVSSAWLRCFPSRSWA